MVAPRGHGNRARDPLVPTTSYRGISWDKRKKLWRVRIYAGPKQVEVGRYKSQELAATAYDCAAVSLGETHEKQLNFTMEHALHALPALEAQKRVFSLLQDFAKKAAEGVASSLCFNEGGRTDSNGVIIAHGSSAAGHDCHRRASVSAAAVIEQHLQVNTILPQLALEGCTLGAAGSTTTADVAGASTCNVATPGAAPPLLSPTCGLAPGPLSPGDPLVDAAFAAAANMAPQEAFLAGMQAAQLYNTSTPHVNGADTTYLLTPAASMSVHMRMLQPLMVPCGEELTPAATLATTNSPGAVAVADHTAVAGVMPSDVGGVGTETNANAGRGLEVDLLAALGMDALSDAEVAALMEGSNDFDLSADEVLGHLHESSRSSGGASGTSSVTVVSRPGENVEDLYNLWSRP